MVLFFSSLTPVPRSTMQLYRGDPLRLLQQRYAAGEITTQEYLERKTRLERDLRSSSKPSGSNNRFDQNAPA
jgi:putative membrane protein